MSEVRTSNTSTFKIEVPYTLVETGVKGTAKPLIVYLHGFNQNTTYFEKKAASMMGLKAYHLFIQAPYPVYDTSRKKDLAKWGRAWYLYDGNQDQFIHSLEAASDFIQQVIEEVREKTEVTRQCMLGYSMGGYVGGYFALSRPSYTDELIVIGGRIKTEVFEGELHPAKGVRILALHGKNDTSVYPGPQEKCINQLRSEGFDATFKLLEEKHKLTGSFVTESKKWLVKSGYVES